MSVLFELWSAMDHQTEKNEGAFQPGRNPLSSNQLHGEAAEHEGGLDTKKAKKPKGEFADREGRDRVEGNVQYHTHQLWQCEGDARRAQQQGQGPQE